MCTPASVEHVLSGAPPRSKAAHTVSITVTSYRQETVRGSFGPTHRERWADGSGRGTVDSLLPSAQLGATQRAGPCPSSRTSLPHHAEPRSDHETEGGRPANPEFLREFP